MSKVPARQSDDQLQSLATEIRERIALCERSAQTTLEHARDIGQRLIAVKDLVCHGQWRKWVRDNLSFSLDTAERMMRLCREWDQLNAAPVQLLGIKDADAYLAAEKRKAKQTSEKEEKAEQEQLDPSSGAAEADQPTPVAQTPGSEDEADIVIEATFEYAADDEPQSVRECYLDPAEADLFCPEQPLGEDAVAELEDTLDGIAQSLADMLDHDAVASLSDFDPLKVALIRHQRTMEQVSAALERKRPAADDVRTAEDEAAVQCVDATEEITTWAA